MVSASYCSSSCASIVNNSKRSRKRKIKICPNPNCSNKFSGRNKYCSLNCVPRTRLIYTQDVVISEIRLFYEKAGRVPLKKEFMNMYKQARKYFGTWNKAVKAAGFEPNPVMFAKRYIADDGHKCDSLSEAIIDNWFYSRGIKHEINYPYPGKEGFTVDFKVNRFWIEFFGLSGQHKKYDELKIRKLKLAKRANLKVIEVYSEDIFPKSRLDVVLRQLLL